MDKKLEIAIRSQGYYPGINFHYLAPLGKMYAWGSWDAPYFSSWKEFYDK